MKVLPYNDTYFNSLLEFCRIESQEDHPASKNMWEEDWENNSHTLPFILKNTDRFKTKGQFQLLIDNGTIIGCSGVYKFTDKVAIAGVRTWLSKPYRTKQYLKNYFLPEQKDWAILNKAEVIALTFNEYNAGVTRLFRIGMATGTRTPRHLFSSNYNELDFPVDIQYTPQWVIYENLTNYRFDWKSIAVHT